MQRPMVPGAWLQNDRRMSATILLRQFAIGRMHLSANKRADLSEPKLPAKRPLQKGELTMKPIILAAALALGLTACTNGLTKEEETAIRDAAVAVAVETIAEAKEAGFDPVQMSESKLRLVNLACTTADKFLPLVEAYIAARNADDPEFEPIDFRGYVASACAIAGAVISVEPEPEPTPAV